MTIRMRQSVSGWRRKVIAIGVVAGLVGSCGLNRSAVAQSPSDSVVASSVIRPGSGNRADEVNSIPAEVDLQRAVLAYKSGQFEEAISRLDGISAKSPSASYYRGLSLLGLKRPDDALKVFESLDQSPESPIEAKLGIGASRLERGDVKEAAEALDGYLKAKPNDLYAHYLLGVALFKQGRADESKIHLARANTDTALSPFLDEYKALIESAEAAEPLPPLPASAGGTGSIVPPENNYIRGNFINRMNAPPGGPGTIPGPGTTGVGGATTGAANPDRRWNLATVNGYEYDTNVALAPGFLITGLGAAAHRPDSRYTFANFGEYRFIQQQDLVAGFIGSTYDTFQFHLPQYNIQDYMGGIYANQAFGDKILGGRYEFHESLLGGKQFTTDHRVTPNFTFREGSFGHVTAFYEFEALTVNGLALTPAQRRTGNINAVGVTQAIYLANGNGRLFLNYRYENAATQGTDFDRNTNQISARVEYPLPGKMVFNAEFRQFFDNYMHANSLDFLGHRRFDNRIEFRTGVQKFLTDHWSLRVDYVYINNTSNVANLFGTSFYSYHRNVIGAQMIYDF